MPQPPNIVVCLTDDHGQWASGCYGNDELWTPTMDHLAASGARLDRAFTPCPVCSPARASFFTGRLPSQHGIHDYLAEMEAGRDHPGLHGQPHLGQRLRGRGYQTAMVGKWHLGRSWQRHEGFDFWFSIARGTAARFGDRDFNDNGRRVQRFGHQAPQLTDAAVRFLRQRDRDRPFFLFVGYTNTHTPHIGEPSRLVQRYRRAAFDAVPDETYHGEHGAARRLSGKRSPEDREQLAQYHAAVTGIDEQVGRLLDELDARQQRRTTLMVYTSDHGHMNGHHGLHSKGNITIPQNFLDESILVPCLIRWPDVIPAGQVLDMPVDHCDLFRTLMEAAGDARPEAYDGPGRSYLRLLRGEPQSWRDACFGEYGNARMIRTAAHKLIRRYPGPNGRFPDELYELTRDPRETINRIDQPALATVRDELSRRLEEHFQRYEDPAKAGRRIADQPICNSHECWRKDPASLASS